jgi:hypothetical protein
MYTERIHERRCLSQTSCSVVVSVFMFQVAQTAGRLGSSVGLIPGVGPRRTLVRGAR